MPEDRPSLKDPPELEPDEYPNWVITREQKLRWRTAKGIADEVFDDDPEAAWYMARSVYNSEIPTHSEPT